MKITTQRSLLWALNFVIVFALIGCVFLMAQKDGRARNRELADYVDILDEKVKDAASRRNSSAGSDIEQAWQLFRTPLDRGFSFEGYVKPPEPEKKKPRDVARKAPDLKGLIEVHMIIAPSRASGPNGNEAAALMGGASIKVKNAKGPKGQPSGLYFYEVGELIGIKQEYRHDEDKLLNEWGPCRLLEVYPDKIVCSWNNEKDKIEIPVTFNEPQKGQVYVSGGGKIPQIGSPEQAAGLEKTPGGVTLPSGKLSKTTQVGKSTVIDWTEEGIIALQNEGEQLLEQIGTKTAKGGRGLEVTSLPGRLSEFGIQPGDVIVDIDGNPVKNKSGAVNYVRKTYKKKLSYNVTVLRNGQTRQLSVNVPKKLSDVKGLDKNVRFGR